MRGSWRPKKDCNILTPTPFPFSWAAQPGIWGPGLSGTCSWFQHLLSNWLNFLCTELYNNLTSTFLPASATISHSIQTVHGPGYILIFLDRMHLLFTRVHFLFWQLGRDGGQYTTHVLRFVCVHMETNPIYCPLQSMQQGIGQKRYVISVVRICNRSSRVSSSSCLFQCEAIFFH